MAKDNRTIHSHIRHGGKIYKPGMEDDLEAAVSSAGIERLIEKGAISGDFKGGKKATPAEPAPAELGEAAVQEEAPAKGKNK
jgi:hypothetical protein